MHPYNWPQPSEQGVIAYTSNRGGSYEIWLVHPETASTYPITQGLGDIASIPYWSPGGRNIAFIGQQNILFIINSTTRLTAQIDQLENYPLLSWSPDNRLLSYTKKDQIIIYDTLHHVSRSIPAIGATDVQWFPSGTELLFTAPDQNEVSQIYRIRANGENLQQLTHFTEGPLHYLRISPNGRLALFTSPGASISIISTINLESGEVHSLEGGSMAKNYYPTWAPNSAAIAYSATEFAQNTYFSRIQTDNPLGSNQRTWAESTCFATPVSWSPQGDKLAFLSGCREAEQANQIWVTDLESSTRIKLVEGGTITALSWWSPRSAIQPRLRTYTNPTYKVSFNYPAHWYPVTRERYEGPDGFFQISAIASDSRLEEVCQREAFHPLQPYGSSPQIFSTRVQGQNACLIFPSGDQPPEMRNQAALIVKYRVPISIEGTLYQYFILWADRNHLLFLSRSLTFL